MNDFSDLHLLCVYCFDTLIDFLSKKDLESLPQLPLSYNEVNTHFHRKNSLFLSLGLKQED
jgi:hypothetical protein